MEFTPIILSLLTLTLLEVILGIDNLVFIAIASSKLPVDQQKSARRFGLILALVLRLTLLASVVWLAKLTEPIIAVFGNEFSFRDLLMLSGGLFLLYKGTQQIHHEVEGKLHGEDQPRYASLSSVIIQIGVLDIVFSFDSVFTAIGMADAYWIMATAILLAIVAMIFASEPLSRFIERHPTIKMLALSFILLVGVMLVADGFHAHIPRGYIYFAISFSIFVESVNTLVRSRKT